MERSRAKFEWKEFMVISMVTLSCAIKTWAHWGDLRIDTGRELYIPQAILAGKELYRDLIYPYGPLAPYLNAAIVYLFGTHLHVLYIWGIALVVVSALLIYFIAREYLSRLGSLVISVAYLLLAFQPGLFNLVLPYSYAASYGSLFSLLFFYSLLRHLNTERNTFLRWAGILAGLATVTKIEFGAACFLTLGLYLLFQVRHLVISRFIYQCLEATMPGLIMAAAGYGWFIRKTTLANWLHDNWAGTQISLYWLERQGFRFSIREIGVLTLISFVCLLFWYLIARAGARLSFVPERRRNVLGLFGVVVAFVVIGWKNFGIVAVHLLRLAVFPVSMYFAGIVLIVVSIYRWKRDGHSKLTIKILTLAVFSVLLNWRVAFHVMPGRYSIYYGSLLFLCFVLVLCDFVSQLFRNSSSNARDAGLKFMLSTELVLLLFCLYPRQLFVSKLITAHGSIGARQSEATLYPEIIGFMKGAKEQGKEMVIVPEETSLYYFADTLCPTRWYVTLPAIFRDEDQENEYIGQLEQHKVEYILMTNRNTKEYGLARFGIDYNQKIYAWIETNYHEIKRYGQFKIEANSEFAAILYRRNGAW